ncbi:YpoC family protein [Bacillota bacterium Lsc_1132]
MDKKIENLLLEWQKIKVRLEEQHRNRNQEEICDLMKKGIALFHQFLLWTNEYMDDVQKPTPLFSDLEFKPVNLAERIEFISSRPRLFHSFIQLSELMGEHEKIYQKKQAMKKASKQNT